MPRRKKYTLSAKELAIYDMIAGELSKNPELAANYDMATIKISILKTIEPFIKNIETVISHFEWYLAKNKKISLFFREKKSSTEFYWLRCWVFPANPSATG